mmetsp:Transcript_501/g.750  ORF Transcript_501/g.750 Transcript_501/m.750 type:complete len:292 (+) Transcript_501:388-1263(+)
MASILDCLLRHCLPPSNDDDSNHQHHNHNPNFEYADDDDERYDPPRPAASHRIVRSFAQHVAAATTRAPPASSSPHDVEEILIVDNGNNDHPPSTPSSDCHHHHRMNSPSSEEDDSNDDTHHRSTNHAQHGLALFWTNLMTGMNKPPPHQSDTEYESVRDHEEEEDNHDDEDDEGEESNNIAASPSPLRTAMKYNEIDHIPSIQLEEVVMPGSDLQKEMATRMSSFVGDVDTLEDECVICMEGFTDSNPRMPTLCGCGQNNTFFHLPCLYQWIEQDRNCPSCRTRLRWEEF